MGIFQALERAAGQNLVADRLFGTEGNDRLKEWHDALLIDEPVELAQNARPADVRFLDSPLEVLRDFFGGAKFHVGELHEVPFVEERVAGNPLAVDVRSVGALQVPHRQQLARTNQVRVRFGDVSRMQDEVALGVPADVKWIRVDRNAAFHATLIDETLKTPKRVDRSGHGRSRVADFGDHGAGTLFLCSSRANIVRSCGRSRS